MRRSSHCFVPGCDSGYRKARLRNEYLGKKNPSMFKAPEDAVLLETWQKAISRKDRVLAPHETVCELHFKDDCIVRHFETKMPGGIIHKMERQIPMLKPDSVPSIFPNPKHLKKKNPKRKTQTPRSSAKKIHLDDDVANIQSPLSFADLKAEMPKIVKPDKAPTLRSSVKEIHLDDDVIDIQSSLSFPDLTAEVPKIIKPDKAPTVQSSVKEIHLYDDVIDIQPSLSFPDLKAEMLKIVNPDKAPTLRTYAKKIHLYNDLADIQSPLSFPDLKAEMPKIVKPDKASIPQSPVKKIHLDDDVADIQPALNFLDLKAKMLKIDKPDNWWITYVDNEIVCGKLDEALQCERHVVINQDLSIKAFLRNKEINLPVMKNIDGLEQISLLLQKIDELIICKDIHPQLLGKCLGYVSNRASGDLCAICVKAQKSELGNKDKRKIEQLRRKKDELALQRKYILRKNERLQMKVSLLKDKLEDALMECKNVKKNVQSAIRRAAATCNGLGTNFNASPP